MQLPSRSWSPVGMLGTTQLGALSPQTNADKLVSGRTDSSQPNLISLLSVSHTTNSSPLYGICPISDGLIQLRQIQRNGIETENVLTLKIMVTP